MTPIEQRIYDALAGLSQFGNGDRVFFIAGPPLGDDPHVTFRLSASQSAAEPGLRGAGWPGAQRRTYSVAILSTDARDLWGLEEVVGWALSPLVAALVNIEDAIDDKAKIPIYIREILVDIDTR